MCTAVTYQTNDFYFGRTLDYEFSFGEEVVITPRNYPFAFRYQGGLNSHYAMIGMAHVANDFPLYYEAVNEKGLGMASLNFVGNAHYFEEDQGKDNLAQFEFIPYILATCSTVEEAKEKLANINITDQPFAEAFPVAQLHWIIADKNCAITVESVESGLHVYDNPVGVLTNNPPFPEQMFALNNYMHLSNMQPENTFLKDIPLSKYSRGMGALGLPGDLSSQSRFVRAVFSKMNSFSDSTEAESVGQFFHIMDTIAQIRGCCKLENGEFEITIYTSCCNADKGIYYYTTYGNRQITGVNMLAENLDSAELVRYPLVKSEQLHMQNE